MSKTYAITGVASGIGARLAAIVKAQGHRVVGFDLAEVTENVDLFVPLDLSDPTSIAKATTVSVPLDGLCNNAGVPPRAGQEAAILAVNFQGTRAFTDAMLPHLNKGASVVNMASRAGHGWRENIAQVKALAALTTRAELDQFVTDQSIDATRCYNLSKEAVLLWTIAMAETCVARDLRINSLSPGGVATGILDDFKRAFGDKMARNVARAGRPGTADEVAEVAAFLLSPASHWIKGEDIVIDGGMGAFNMADALDLDVMRGGGA